MSRYLSVNVFICLVLLAKFNLSFSSPLPSADSNTDTVIDGGDPQVSSGPTLDGFDPVANLTEGPTLDDLLNDLANIESELADDPIQDSGNLVRDLVLQCEKLNISTDVLDPTSPNFNPERDWDIIDAITDGIRVMACDRMNWTEVKCPPFTDTKKCLYQPIKLLDGYGGLGCYTQCAVISCSEVGENELVAELNQTSSAGNDTAEKLENAQAVNRALLKIITQPDLIETIAFVEEFGENATSALNGTSESVLENELTIPVEVGKDGTEGEGLVEVKTEDGVEVERIPLETEGGIVQLSDGQTINVGDEGPV